MFHDLVAFFSLLYVFWVPRYKAQRHSAHGGSELAKAAGAKAARFGAFDASGVETAKVCSVLRARHASVMNSIMPVMAMLRLVLGTRVASGPVDAVPALLGETVAYMHEVGEVLPELARWAGTRVALLELVVSTLRISGAAPVDAETASKARLMLSLLLSDRSADEQLAVLLLARAVYDRANTTAEFQHALHVLDTYSDGSLTEVVMLTEECLRHIIPDEELLDADRLNAAIRLKNTHYASEVVLKNLGPWSDVKLLLILITKILGTKTTPAPGAVVYPASAVPEVVANLTYVTSWPPVEPLPASTKSLLEYTFGFLTLYVELQTADAAHVTAKTDVDFVEAGIMARFPTWQSFEIACDTQMPETALALCNAELSVQMDKVFQLYKATKSKRGVLEAKVTLIQAQGAIDVTVHDEVARVLQLAALARLLKASGSAQDRMNVLKALDSTAKYFPTKLFSQAQQLIKAVPNAHIRLLLLEYITAKIISDKRLAAQYKVAPSIPIADDDWEWLSKAVVACRMLAKFPLAWQEALLALYDKPVALFRALVGRCGTSKTHVAVLVGIVADPVFRPTLTLPAQDYGVDGKDVVGDAVAQVVHDILTQADPVLRDCGRALAFVLLGTCTDPIMTAHMVLTIVNSLSVAFSSMAYRHGLMLRDLMIELLAWFSTQFPGDTLPSGLRQRHGAYQEALVAKESLFYRIHGAGVTFGLEEINPQNAEGVTRLRVRLLEHDQFALAKVLMCSQVPLFEVRTPVFSWCCLMSYSYQVVSVL